MSENPKHYKMISRDNIYITTNDRYKEIRPYQITIFNDPYLQQLYLNLVVEYKHVFKKISLTPKVRFIIPIYDTHKMVEKEQENLFNIITELETDNRFLFNFFAKDFQEFKFKNIDLNLLLHNAVTINHLEFGLHNQMSYTKKQIKPENLFDTLQRIEEESAWAKEQFLTPDDLIKKNDLLIRLQHLIADKRVTYKAYQILQQLFFEDFELFKKFITNSNQSDVSKSLFEKPEYPLICKKYGETEIKYLINQYLA